MVEALEVSKEFLSVEGPALRIQVAPPVVPDSRATSSPSGKGRSVLRSMTGFGAAASEDIGGYALRIEVRSVNHRHLLIKTRAPSEFLFLEGQIEKLAKKKLFRGSVAIHIKQDHQATHQARVNQEALKNYRNELEALARDLELDPIRSLDSLLSLPGVIDATVDHGDQVETLTKPLLGLVEEALDHLVEMREAEGLSLTNDLKKNAQALAQVVEKIEGRMPEVVKTHQAGLEKRVQDLLDGRASLEPSDLAREVALLSDKLDVSEEIARLESHLNQLDLFLKEGGDIGRKLDFLVQEIFREINTIGSKCSDADVAHWVVDAKAYAERLREQVQNIE